jgi:hypothetical protein
MCINLISQESNVCPRSRTVTASNQNDFFHFFNTQPKLLGEGKTAVDMLHYPPPKITLRESVIASSRYW